MDSERVLIIIGSVLAVIGSVHAYLLKGLMNSINDVRIDLVRTITRHDSTIEGVAENKHKISEIDTRVHSLEKITYAP